ncbi:MAG TPA: hypothetical protein VG871_07825 [Vicinamibacterales bacterium]|nr:hypothetical protein [Vicinamibacterales bacterium]
MSEQQDRDAALREIAKKQVVYRIAGMDALPVRRDIQYHASLPMDVYYPPEPRGARVPATVIAFGFPDPEGRIRMFGPITSWARLIAASGSAAVVLGTASPADDLLEALGYLRANAASLGLDERRIGLFATSGNAPVALATLMNDRTLACAALLYGYTLDLDGTTAVADAARQFGFANASAERSLDDLPPTVPLLFVRAGRDQFQGLNAALDRVVSAALARNLPVALVNHPTGAHGFDLDEDTPASRRVIGDVLAFLRGHLLDESR